jgi:hypothetical protein
MGQLENKVQLAILKHLRAKDILCWRNNSTGVYDAKLRGYRSNPYLIKGIGDILAIHKGVFYSIECKAKTKQSPDQIIWKKRLTQAGGVYVLAKSVEDVDNALDQT